MVVQPQNPTAVPPTQDPFKLLAKPENSDAGEYKRIGIGMIMPRHAYFFENTEIQEFGLS
jgi:hypothetical protein